MASDPATRSYVAETFLQGANESGIAKAPLLRQRRYPAGRRAAPLAWPAGPALARPRPEPTRTSRAKLRHTVWERRPRTASARKLVVEGSGSPIRAADCGTTPPGAHPLRGARRVRARPERAWPRPH
ncbi:hypothetical protein [Streptosporangium vulgare]|uniref:hypothetical protein n=1 Tax=Streptosporangium vulgare TaxID=46190 RepID=UPI0031E2E4DE